MIKNNNFRNVSMPSFRRIGGHAVRGFGDCSFDGWALLGDRSLVITSSKYSLSSFPSGGVFGSASKPVFEKIFLGRGLWSRRKDW